MTLDQIQITQLCGPTEDAVFSVHWPRLTVEQLFIGQRPDQVLKLTPRIFSLCRHAQTLAARLALLQAVGEPAVASETELAQLHLEAARETLRKLLLDWPVTFSGNPADSVWLSRWRTAHSLAQLATLAADWVYGQSPESWLQQGESGWLAWSQQGSTAPARWVAQLTQSLSGCALLPMLNAAQLSARRADWQTERAPQWHGLAHETGALACEAQHLPATLGAQQLARARLLARLVQLARWLSGQSTLHTSAASMPDGGALAVIHSARGPLIHCLSLNPHGRVTTYQVVPPTAWGAHPQGVIQRTLNALPKATPLEWQQQVALIDPCVAYKFNFLPEQGSFDA